MYDLLNNYDYNMYSYSLKGRADNGVLDDLHIVWLSQVYCDISY